MAQELKLNKMRVEELKTELITASPLDSLTKIIGMLREKNAYEVFVAAGPKIGMVNIRDILKATHIHTRKASSIVIQIPTLNPKSAVAEAAGLMTRYRVRALPIVKEREIVGEITALSICKALNQTKELGFTINKIMISHPTTLTINDRLGKAKALINRMNIDHLPILQDNKIAGVLTSQDLLDTLIPPEKLTRFGRKPEAKGVDRLTVRGLMERPLICSMDEKASSVLRKMVDGNKTCALLSFGEELQGVVTYRDFVKLLVEPEKVGIPIYMVGLPDDAFQAESAQEKFERVVDLLKRSYPDILEARCIIKTSTSVKTKSRKRYEVKVHISTPRKKFSHSEQGWELPTIFDKISNRLKTIIRRRKKTRRKR
ncbi:CBS domain-containing protein [[Eubacterium] cellulosolvens]